MIKGSTGTTHTFYYLNTQLKELFTIEAENAGAFHGNVATLIRNGTIELINKKGEIIKKLAGYGQTGNTCYGMIQVQAGMLYPEREKRVKWGCLNEKGEPAIPVQFDSCTAFQHGLAAVLISELYLKRRGIIDAKGNYVIKPSSDIREIMIASPRLFWIKGYTGWKLINIEGKVCHWDIPIKSPYFIKTWPSYHPNIFPVCLNRPW
jgi:hypothetical protein